MVMLLDGSILKNPVCTACVLFLSVSESQSSAIYFTVRESTVQLILFAPFRQRE